MVAEKVHEKVTWKKILSIFSKNPQFLIRMDERMKCRKKKNGCLKCLLVVPSDEFEEKFKKFVKERKEVQSAISSQKAENS